MSNLLWLKSIHSFRLELKAGRSVVCCSINTDMQKRIYERFHVAGRLSPNIHPSVSGPISGRSACCSLAWWLIRQHSCLLSISVGKDYLWLLKCARFNG